MTDVIVDFDPAKQEDPDHQREILDQWARTRLDVELHRGLRYEALTNGELKKPLAHQAALIRIKGEEDMMQLNAWMLRAEVQRQLLFIALGREIPVVAS
jgi:hypothetical protein